jgi:hypothetical protein
MAAVDISAVDRATVAARRVQAAVQQIVITTDGRTEEIARAADESIRTVLQGLRDLGATELQPSRDPAIEIPFHALCPPALYELETLLKQARILADRVDQARGMADKETGEGFVWGDFIRELEAKAGLELHGPDSVRE